MCVIAVQPKGKKLTRENALAMWTVNDDGGGFAYISDGAIQMRKFMDFNEWWLAYDEAVTNNPESPFIAHMRIATHGTVDLTNVHPFIVDEHTVMAHNGIIHNVEEDKTGKLSDTRMFIRDVLPELPETWLDSKYLAGMISNWVGWSKLAFLTVNPALESTVYIMNEKSGDWQDGIWYSNLNHSYRYGKKKGSSKSIAFGQGPWTYSEKTNYKGGTSNGQSWEYKTQSWVDSDETNEDKVNYPWPSGQVVVPSEDRIDEAVKEYESLTEYWADSGESIEHKGGQTWKGADLPWSSTITPAERRELEPLWEDLKMAREYAMLDKPVAYDEEFQYWWCYGCDEAIDLESVFGDCDCWDKYCLDCSRVAAECQCYLGYSTNLTSNFINPYGETKEDNVIELPTPL